MPLADTQDVTAELERMIRRVQAAAASRQQKSRGRSSQEIRKRYRRYELYLPPSLAQGLGQMAALQEARSGRHTCMADVARLAIERYLRLHLAGFKGEENDR